MKGGKGEYFLRIIRWGRKQNKYPILYIKKIHKKQVRYDTQHDSIPDRK